ncbi:alpha-ketoglutarate dehydrogenase complex subunit Kgd1 [Aspergillus arachidicola]|uniref:2-oxoglutarate dehydrogenase, mitochondrial n=1 Tax=Aspergillus arachidicola TaxID=656916 RepID=A0A2G7FVE2_9EURO|nr:alpha-ketoglutarate dehydrogenase complex subunit Kgd1 [Aspergillus arachidicola]
MEILTEKVNYPPPGHNGDFLQGSAATYIDMMYSSWKNDPSSVHLSWQAYFHNVENGHIPMDQAFMPPPELATASPRTSVAPTNEERIRRKELQLSHYGLGEQDLDLVLTVGTGSVQDFTSEKPKTLREVIAACEKTYCSTMGIEYMHISNQEQVDWIRARIEGAQRHQFTDEEKRRMLHGLVRATSWEKFVAAKFPNEKRFRLDGVESYIPALEARLNMGLIRLEWELRIVAA